MLAVLFESTALLDEARIAGTLDALDFLGVPYAVDGTPEAGSIKSAQPAGATWVVCKTGRAVRDAYRNGFRVVAVGFECDLSLQEGDITIESVESLSAALGANYTRTALILRDVVASEFEDT